MMMLGFLKRCEKAQLHSPQRRGMNQGDSCGGCRLSASLRSDAGFTIAEQLFTIVMVGLLGIVVAAGISVAVHVYTEIRDVADTHSVLNMAATSVCDELRYGYDIVQVDESGSQGSSALGKNSGLSYGLDAYAFESPVQNARVVLVNVWDGSSNPGNIAVQAIVPSDASSSGILTQDDRIPAAGSVGSALGNSAVSLVNTPSGSNITVQITRLSYQASSHTWLVNLTAYKNAKRGSGGQVESVYEASTGDLYIRALNVE